MLHIWGGWGLKQNGHHFADNISKFIFFHENCTLIEMSQKFVSTGPINNMSTLVQIMAWCWTGDKSLSEPITAQFTDAYMCQSASASLLAFRYSHVL